MSSIITAVFKATIGLLVNKGRDKAAEKLKDGDVTDQKFRGLIVREIDDIKSQLKGLARKDLLASISFFKEGIELLYEVFGKARRKREHGTIKEEATAGTASAEAVSLAKGMRRLELTDLNESALKVLSNAKKRFEETRRKATEAFANEALELSDRVLAMQYRVMATILETVDDPQIALAACRVCIEELHNLSAVKEYFTVELNGGFWARFSKEERRAIISATCHVNRTIYDVILMVSFGNNQLSANNWPCVDTGEEKVNPLFDGRVSKVLQKQGMEHCCVTPWSFGEKGEEEHKLRDPRGFATNADGQFIIVDDSDKSVKVFDSGGKFVLQFHPERDYTETGLRVFDVATDVNNSNIFVLVGLGWYGAEWEVRVFSHTADLLHKFPVRGEGPGRLAVTNNKVLVLTGWTTVHVYEHEGRYVHSYSFGEGILKVVHDVIAGPDGLIMTLDDSCVFIFTEDGKQQRKFNINTKEDTYGCIALHPSGEFVVVAGWKRGTDQQCVAIYTKDGEFVRRIVIVTEENNFSIAGITVSMEGHIAVAFGDAFVSCNGKVIVL